MRVIALRRRSKQAAVFAAEPRGTLIPHTHGGTSRVEVFVQHQLAGFLKPQLLLVLQRAHTRERAEMLTEGGRTHVRAIRQVVPLHRLDEVLLESLECTIAPSLAYAVARHDLARLARSRRARRRRGCRDGDQTQ